MKKVLIIGLVIGLSGCMSFNKNIGEQPQTWVSTESCLFGVLCSSYIFRCDATDTKNPKCYNAKLNYREFNPPIEGVK